MRSSSKLLAAPNAGIWELHALRLHTPRGLTMDRAKLYDRRCTHRAYGVSTCSAPCSHLAHGGMDTGILATCGSAHQARASDFKFHCRERLSKNSTVKRALQPAKSNSGMRRSSTIVSRYRALIPRCACRCTTFHEIPPATVGSHRVTCRTEGVAPGTISLFSVFPAKGHIHHHQRHSASIVSQAFPFRPTDDATAYGENHLPETYDQRL